MNDSIGVLMPEGTQRPPCGEFYCVGHSDEASAHLHCTPYEYFGDFGVAVTKTGDNPPKVSLVDVTGPQVDYDLDEVPALILQLCQALEVGQRAVMQVPATRLAEQVRALFPAAG